MSLKDLKKNQLSVVLLIRVSVEPVQQLGGVFAHPETAACIDTPNSNRPLNPPAQIVSVANATSDQSKTGLADPSGSISTVVD